MVTKTLFEAVTREELIGRIQGLTETSTAQWGRMNIYQMIRHCTLWDAMILRNKHYKRAWIGRLFGPMLLKQELKDDRPMRRNSPTIPAFNIAESWGDVQAAKGNWIHLLQEYGRYALPDHCFIHPFFGPMTKAQIGQLAYKHTDHHLRQFNG